MSEAYKTLDQIRQYILRKLGGCNVSVELSSSQVDDSIQDALDTFNQYLCKPVPNLLANQTGSVVIPLPPTARGVVNVKCLFPDDNRVYAQMSIWEVMYRMVYPRMPIGDWYTLKSYYKMYQQIRGTDPDWYEDESTNTLYVDCASGPYDVFYILSCDLAVEDIANLKGAYTKMFRDFAVAEAKITLSRIRGKYGNSIPTPGGVLTLDADALRTEGDVTKQQIVEKLEKIARFEKSPIMWG